MIKKEQVSNYFFMAENIEDVLNGLNWDYFVAGSSKIFQALTLNMAYYPYVNIKQTAREINQKVFNNEKNADFFIKAGVLNVPSFLYVNVVQGNDFKKTMSSIDIKITYELDDIAYYINMFEKQQVWNGKKITSSLQNIEQYLQQLKASFKQYSLILDNFKADVSKFWLPISKIIEIYEKLKENISQLETNAQRLKANKNANENKDAIFILTSQEEHILKDIITNQLNQSKNLIKKISFKLSNTNNLLHIMFSHMLISYLASNPFKKIVLYSLNKTINNFNNVVTQALNTNDFNTFIKHLPSYTIIEEAFIEIRNHMLNKNDNPVKSFANSNKKIDETTFNNDSFTMLNNSSYEDILNIYNTARKIKYRFKTPLQFQKIRLTLMKKEVDANLKNVYENESLSVYNRYVNGWFTSSNEADRFIDNNLFVPLPENSIATSNQFTTETSFLNWMRLNRQNANFNENSPLFLYDKKAPHQMVSVNNENSIQLALETAKQYTNLQRINVLGYLKLIDDIYNELLDTAKLKETSLKNTNKQDFSLYGFCNVKEVWDILDRNGKIEKELELRFGSMKNIKNNFKR